MTIPTLCRQIIKGYEQEKSGFDDDMIHKIMALADQAEEILKMDRALKAIHARVDGVFDDPDLMSFGPLHDNLRADVKRIAESTR